MDQNLKKIFDFIQHNENLTADEKNTFSKAVKDADKELEITAFKLDRTEKVKRTTAILLEETIEELEQKRKAVEAQNRELEIESSLERVRSVAMGMQNPADMVDVCKIISEQLEFLKVKDIRNVQTAVIYEAKGTYINYEYYARHNKLLTTEVSYKTHHLQEQFANQMLKGADEFFSPSLEGKQVKDWYEYQKTTNQFADSFLEGAQTLNYYMFSLGPVALGISTYSPLKEVEINLFKRFRNVFELAYRRFTDIQKAEAQAREAQIEAALERIRSRALAMHNSSDVGDVSDLLFSELEKMDINPMGFTIMVFDREQDKYELWRAKEVAHQGVYETFSIKAMYDKLDQYIPGFTEELESRWNSGSPFFIAELSGKKRISFIEANSEMGNYTKDQFEKVLSIYPDPIFWHLIFFKYGWLGLIQNEKLAADILLVITRFADVFEFAHTRFLDLKKAEVQAREAKIEAALEKVRSNSLAMNRSEDLKEVVAAIFQKFEELEFGIDKGAALIMTFSPESKDHTQWITDADQTYPVPFFIPFTEHSIALDQINAREKGLDFYSKLYNKKEKNEYFGYLFQHTEYKRIPKTIQELILNSRHFGISIAFENSSAIAIPSADGKLVSGDDINILKRFSRVFEQSYTRFLDIQKAEFQAREAQIEAALERVRSRTMAMQHSEELLDVASILFQQVKGLGVPQWNCGFNIWNIGDKEFTYYPGSTDGVISPSPCKIPLTEHPVFMRFDESRKRGDELLIYEKQGEEQEDHYRYMLSLPGVGDLLRSMLDAGFELPTFQIDHVANFLYGNLIFITFEHFPEMHDVFKRFAKVFEQTYTRFLDLQKAEAQAREAQIEAALERVRSRSLAMFASADLSAVVYEMFTELVKLDAQLDRCLILIVNPQTLDITWYLTGKEGLLSNNGFLVQDNPHPSHQAYLEGWRSRRKKWLYLLAGDEKRSWDSYGFTQTGLSQLPDFIKADMAAVEAIHLTISSDDFGCLIASSLSHLSEAHASIVDRFTRVFNQTYTRFLDLKKAEFQTKEAVKASSLDRVRAEIASMRTVNDLQRITPLIWRELNTLGVPFIRCGVFIMNEANEHVQAHLSAPDGHSLAAFDLPFHFNELFIQVVEHWRQGNIFETHWNKQEFMSFMKSMIQQGQVHDPETFQGASAPPESLCLHFVPFKQGMLYAGNTTPLELEELQLVKTLAEAFSIAYARYDDFRQLEEAKNQTEITLHELKSTQAQLIQSEKMASLGQLIAGIAHEINTPLGAINASINTITDSSQQSIKLLPNLVKALTESELNLFMELVNRSSINNNSLSSKEEREIRRKITAQFEDKGISEADDFADILVDMGIYDEIDNYFPLFKTQTMQAAYHLSMQIKNSKNIKMAVDRASKVVFALKNYARYGNEHAMVEANIVDGLETVLTLYQNQFKHGIALHKEFAEVPPILCYPDELNQVWTNLIHNAIQAMDGKGELSISVTKTLPAFETLAGLQVRITDTGKGIAPEIKERIFDAFFTTKPTGEGSGLGLYIVKQIIDKHRGSITIESEEGKGSSFIVCFPISD